MEKKLSNCSPLICNQEILMTGSGIFIYREVYKKNCLASCKLKSTCGIIISLLEKGKHEEALQTLKNSKLWKM